MFKKIFKIAVCKYSSSCKNKGKKTCHKCTRNEVLECKDNYQKEHKQISSLPIEYKIAKL